ncbi:phytoene desaturase family protein [Romboutsia sp.]|uniref:phytoene desaturase family protein n=1 Tax=Romboutsia sp. TaxID=1965302 RepID=UPI003F34354E
MKKALIVGAGIGGLCTAIRLLNKGYDVTIVEKENTIGGKVNVIGTNQFKFDLTASILMTPDIYTEIFKECKKDYRDYIELTKLEPTYNVSYYDGKEYKFYSDLRRMTNTLESIQPGLSIEYIDFLSKSMKKYLVSKKYLLDKPMMKINEVLNIETLKNIISINPFEITEDYICKVISNEKLQEFLIFQSMYIGVNPYTNSSIYTLIPAISHTYGLWYIKGGFYQYIKALEKLIYDLGGKIITNTNVEEIIVHKNKVKGLRTNRGAFKSDIFVCNADFSYAMDKLIKHKKTKNIDKIKEKEYSCSTFIIYLGLNKKYDKLKVHNIYINKNFKVGIESPFKGLVCKYPSFYIYCPSSIDNTVCEKGKETLNIVVRVPNLSAKNINWNEKFITEYRNNIINQVKQIKGLEDIEENIIYESYLTPVDLKNKFNSYKGTAFGISHKLNQTTYFRPHMKDKKIKNLYFIGSSTHPGNGVSVIIGGSKVLVEKIT